jgi:CubicO group peptidase (beta-lactamase class C family)
METRALAIALFYATGTAVGGITGPLLFGQLIHTGDSSKVAIGFFIGAGAMALGGVAELVFGVRAEQQSLENIAKPLTAEEADTEQPAPAAPPTDADDRIRRRHERERRGLTRVRPGPGGTGRYHSPGMLGTAGTASRYAAASDAYRDREIEELVRALQEHGAAHRRELRQMVDANRWGPGRFGPALRGALDEGRATRLTRGRYGPPGGEATTRQASRGRPQPPRGRPA